MGDRESGPGIGMSTPGFWDGGPGIEMGYREKGPGPQTGTGNKEPGLGWGTGNKNRLWGTAIGPGGLGRGGGGGFWGGSHRVSRPRTAIGIAVPTGKRRHRSDPGGVREKRRVLTPSDPVRNGAPNGATSGISLPVPFPRGGGETEGRRGNGKRLRWGFFRGGGRIVS